MSDEITATEAEQVDPAASDETKVFDADYVSKLRAESAKYRTEAKANRTAAEELAALKAAQMTETEKAAARMAELESKVKGYETKEQVSAWKADVAEKSGVPVAALAGSTLEEIQAHAEVLKSLIPQEPAARKGAVGPYVPPEGGTPGASLGSPADIFGQFLSDQLGRKA